MSAAKRFIPLLDRVLVEKVKRDAKTAAGILLPDTASKMNEGVVIAVGPGRVAQDGKTISPQLKVPTARVAQPLSVALGELLVRQRRQSRDTACVC